MQLNLFEQEKTKGMSLQTAKIMMNHLNYNLRKASNVYYNSGEQLFTDADYDKHYRTLLRLEDDFKIRLSDSMTQQVGTPKNIKWINEPEYISI